MFESQIKNENQECISKAMHNADNKIKDLEYDYKENKYYSSNLLTILK